MSCDETRASLSEVLTGAAEPARREAVLAHLAGCAACRLEADEIARVVALVRGAAPPGEAPAPPRWDDVLAAARAPRGRARRLLVRAAALAIAALLGAGVDRGLSRGTPPPPRETPDVRSEARAVVAGRPGSLGASLAVLDVLARKR
jgi:predicted anti-sigma-YlaC factor YlaD